MIVKAIHTNKVTMATIKTKTKFKIHPKAKTISVSSSGLIKILDEFSRKLDCLHEDSIITDSHWKAEQKANDHKYRILWSRYEDLHEDYRLLARNLITKTDFFTKSITENEIIKKGFKNLKVSHRSDVRIIEAKKAEIEDNHAQISYLESRIDSLRAELKNCNPKHPEFETDSSETPHESLSRWFYGRRIH